MLLQMPRKELPKHGAPGQADQQRIFRQFSAGETRKRLAAARDMGSCGLLFSFPTFKFVLAWALGSSRGSATAPVGTTAGAHSPPCPLTGYEHTFCRKSFIKASEGTVSTTAGTTVDTCRLPCPVMVCRSTSYSKSFVNVSVGTAAGTGSAPADTRADTRCLLCQLIAR